MSGELTCRFRHVSGDLGPFRFPLSSNVQDLKERLFREWPKDGPLTGEPPGSPSDVKVILGGRFLEPSENLTELRSAMGDPGDDTVVTMHVVVRAPAAAKHAGKVGKEEQPKTCGCVVQ